LSAGSLIHHFHTNDIWEMAKKGSKSQKLTLSVIAIGGLSLAGIFPFAGFWSKDLILEALHHQPIFYYTGLIVSFCTSYYVFRLLFILYFRSEPAHGHHDDHGMGILKLCMNFPLVTLAGISFIAGLMGSGLFHHTLLKFISPEAHGELSLPLALTGTGVAAAGLILAYWNYIYRAAKPVAVATGPRKILENKYYLDDLFEKVLGKAVLLFSAFLNWFDKKMISGKMVDGTGRSTVRLGTILSRLQSGELQDYLLIMFLVGSLVVYFLGKY
jgi:NADH-quinone oxidoreductase subunit L